MLEAVRVLLVEDSPCDATLIELMLSEVTRERFVVGRADRLASALQHLKEQKSDVMLLDLSLPDSRGLDTVREIRAAAPELPVVVLTGLDDEDLAIETMRHGTQDYLI